MKISKSSIKAASRRKVKRRKSTPKKQAKKKLYGLLLKGLKTTRRKPARKSSQETPREAQPSAPAPAPTQLLVQPATMPQAFPVSTHLPLQTDAYTQQKGVIQESIQSFLIDQRSEHTRRAYEKDLTRFLKFLLGKNLHHSPRSLDRTLIIAYKSALLGEGLQHTTIDRHLATLKSFFRWLVEDGILEKSPAEGVRFLNPKRLSPTIGFSNEEVVKILKTPNLHTRTGALHHALLMVLFYCGLRRSEVCDLKTNQVGLERGHRYFRLTGKGNSERIVVIVEPVWNAIRYYYYMSQRDFVRENTLDLPLFQPVRNNRTGKKLKPLDSSTIYYVVKKYAKLAGISAKVSPHSCRATAISNARDHNVPDRAIQEFAGWATTTMITRYDKRKTALEKSAAHEIRYDSGDRSSSTAEGSTTTSIKPSTGAGVPAVKR